MRCKRWKTLLIDVRKAFFKQGQARINRHWRFYFNIVGDTYIIRDIVPHPKK